MVDWSTSRPLSLHRHRCLSSPPQAGTDNHGQFVHAKLSWLMRYHVQGTFTCLDRHICLVDDASSPQTGPSQSGGHQCDCPRRFLIVCYPAFYGPLLGSQIIARALRTRLHMAEASIFVARAPAHVVIATPLRTSRRTLQPHRGALWLAQGAQKPVVPRPAPKSA